MDRFAGGAARRSSRARRLPRISRRADHVSMYVVDFDARRPPEMCGDGKGDAELDVGRVAGRGGRLVGGRAGPLAGRRPPRRRSAPPGPAAAVVLAGAPPAPVCPSAPVRAVRARPRPSAPARGRRSRRDAPTLPPLGRGLHGLFTNPGLGPGRVSFAAEHRRRGAVTVPAPGVPPGRAALVPRAANFGK
ncbi:hypothetical protein EVAR_65652_1 [Eumeta japonica]|uniref:Uncharacterized protein n=1 Tax=Eumeta variegata TaxID=151549 RepID=A0A4C1Z8Y8_EUMVA|nr:hypothetical protein EVAR_65652_1 [Eumeta japonica]